ncbi:MAG: hypothetical protein ABIQ18_10505 [Umezawaea sp.]
MALLLGQVGQAVAAGNTDEQAARSATDQAAALIQKVSPTTDENGVRLSSTKGPVAVSLPTSADHTLRLGAGEVQVGLGLPEVAAGRTARTLADGKVAFVDPASSVQVVSERVGTVSARTLVVLNDSSAPGEYRFDLHAPTGSTLSAQPDGGVHVMDAKDTVLAQIAAPWAKDANGNGVKTSYRIDGGTLVQTVQTDGNTTFPVVADPNLTFGFGVYLNLWGWEANSYGAGLGIILAGGAVAICTLGNIPEPLAQLVRLVCGAGIGAAAFALLSNLYSFIRSGFFQSGTCYQKKILPSLGNGWVGVDGSNCS